MSIAQLPRAVRAYQASSAHRTARQQEADVFLRANGALKAARDAGPVARARALADNRRLWLMVADLVRDPDNALPDALKASIASVGIAVQREMREDAPDWDFLIAVNENMAAGLSQVAA
jgi:flagellar biosynthesis regulator FlaF